MSEAFYTQDIDYLLVLLTKFQMMKGVYFLRSLTPAGIKAFFKYTFYVSIYILAPFRMRLIRDSLINEFRDKIIYISKKKEHSYLQRLWYIYQVYI